MKDEAELAIIRGKKESMFQGTEITCEAVVMKNFPDLYLKSNHRSLSREYESDKGQKHRPK